jgi:hypothetical protein
MIFFHTCFRGNISPFFCCMLSLTYNFFRVSLHHTKRNEMILRRFRAMKHVLITCMEDILVVKKHVCECDLSQSSLIRVKVGGQKQTWQFLSHAYGRCVKWMNQKMVRGTIVIFVENWGMDKHHSLSLSLPTTLSCSYVPTPHKTFTSPLGFIFPLLCSHTAYLCRILILIYLFCQMHGMGKYLPKQKAWQY